MRVETRREAPPSEGVIFILFAELPIALFTSEAPVAAVGVDCRRLVSYAYLFSALGMVVVQTFDGAGDTVTPTFINIYCFRLFQIPLAYLLALSFGFGSNGVFFAIAVAESVMAPVATMVFRRGAWKDRGI